MGSWISKSKKTVESRLTQQDNAVLKLKMQRDELKDYQKNLSHKMEKEKDLARTLLSQGKKDRAKLLLKKKRYLESLMSNCEKQLDSIEEMCHSLEFAQMEASVVESLEKGNIALKKLNEMMSVEDVEKILDETREAIEKQSEIDALLSNNLSPEDLEAVETELETIMEEENVPRVKNKVSPSDSDSLPLPDVPESPIPTSKEKEPPLERSGKILVAAS